MAKPVQTVFAAAILVLLVGAFPAAAQEKSRAYVAPRTSDGKPDLQGIWEARSAAAGNLEAHSASMGIRAGESSIVDPPDGKLPYLPSALAQRAENFKKRATADPMAKCFLPGVPRVTYIPYPFQIFQTPKFIAIAYEYVHASRTIHMDGSQHLDNIDFWMGDSRGHWEGETLVVEVTDNIADTWLDDSGNFHSEQMKVTERYRRTAPNVLDYEATIEDPKVFSKPWKIHIPLYLHEEKNAQLYEYECQVYRDESASK